MFEKMFELGILISVKDMFTPGFMKAAAGMDVLQKQAVETQKRLDGFKSMAAVGAGITTLGAGMAFGLTKAVEAAGNFQTALTTIQDITGSTNGQMQNLGNTIMNVSAQVSRFTDMDVAGFAQQLTSAGLPGGLKSVQNLLLPVTQFADAQMYEGKIGSGQDAVKMGLNMAHLLGHYDPTSLGKSLNMFNKYSNMEPGSSDDLYQTLKYLAPSSRMLHMNETSMMQMAALANRVGLTGSHGGTNSADLVLRLIPGYAMGMGGKPSPGAMAAMQQLGMVNAAGQSQFFSKNGLITSFPKMVQTLINDGKKFNPEMLTKLYGHVFGMQGGRAATLFANPQILKQLQLMEKQLQHTKSIAQIQRDQQNTPQGQMYELRANAMSAMLRVAIQLGTVLNPFLHTLNRGLDMVLTFEQQHPKLLKMVAAFFSMATAAALVIGPLMGFVGVIGYLKTSGMIASAISGIGEAFTGLGSTLLDVALGPVGIAIAAAILLYEAFSHNFLGIRTKTMQAWGYLKTETPKVWNSVQHVVTGVWAKISPTVGKAANAVWGSVQGAFTQVGAFVKKIWPEVSQITTAVWKFMHDYITAELQLVWIVVKTVVQGIWVTLQAAWTIISTEVKVAWTLIVDVIKLAWTLVSGVVEIGLDLLTGHWKQAWVDFKNLLGTGWSEITKLFGDLWNGLGQIAASYVTAAAQWGSGIVTALWHGIQSLWPWLQHSFTTLLSDILPKWALKDLGLSVTASSIPTQASHSNYAQLSPGATGGGDIHIHNNIAPGAIVVHAAAGHETQAGNAVYSAITKRAVTASRSRGIRPVTSYAR